LGPPTKPDFGTLANYEQYRKALAADSDHKRNAAALEGSGAIVSMERSFIARVDLKR
jgi:hypothetical protein